MDDKSITNDSKIDLLCIFDESVEGIHACKTSKIIYMLSSAEKPEISI